MSTPLIRRIRPYIGNDISWNRKGANKWKFFPPWYPTTPIQKLIPALDPSVKVPLKPRNVQTMFELGPDARLRLLGERVTKLIKFERIELQLNQAIETRMYAERLITEAIRYGDCHRHTMELADFWLHEKALVHKLFKVLVPRYAHYTKAFTSIFYLAPHYQLAAAKKSTWKVRQEHRSGPFPAEGLESRLTWRERGVIELKGNPLPPMRVPPPTNANILTNVLMAAARDDVMRRKLPTIANNGSNKDAEQRNNDTGHQQIVDQDESRPVL